jgi:hypothetical protein
VVVGAVAVAGAADLEEHVVEADPGVAAAERHEGRVGGVVVDGGQVAAVAQAGHLGLRDVLLAIADAVGAGV